MSFGLIETGLICLFVLAVFSLYAAIQSKQSKITFFLVPLILVTGIVSGYAIYSLQGTAIKGVPEGKLEVIHIDVKKPWIWVLVVHEGDAEPKFYGLPYSDENSKSMQGLKRRMEMQGPQVGEIIPYPRSEGTKDADTNLQFKPENAPPLPSKNDATSDNYGYSPGMQ